MNTNYDSTYSNKLSKRAIVRRMWLRAISGKTVNNYNMKYVARRLGKTVPQTRQIVCWMNDNNMIRASVVGANFLFTF